MNKLINTGKWFDKLYLMILENTGWSQVQNCKFVDYFNKNGIVFNNWIAAGHPSASNYRALMSANHWSWTEYEGINRPNIGDNVSVYVENFRGIPADRHNPFMDMQSTQIITDPKQAILADIHYLGMDDQNDAHSASLDIADMNVIEAIDYIKLHKLVSNSRDLLFVVFDEAFGATEWFTNHVFAGMIGFDKLNLGTGKITSLIHHQDFAIMLYNNWEIPLPALSENVNLSYCNIPLWKLP